LVQKYWMPVCLALLLPFLLLGFFNFPSADDYSYAMMALTKGFVGAQIEWYQAWSGRYISSALLSVSPMVYRSFLGYKFIGLVTFLLFMLSSYYFISALLKNLLNKKQVWAAYVLFSLVYLCEMPSVSEGFHWFPGVVNYSLALMLFIAGVGYYLKSTNLSLAKGAVADFDRHRVLDALVLSVLSFLLPGVNESLVVVWLFLIAVLFVGIGFYRRKLQWSLLVPVFFGLVGFYIVFRAPGNEIRGAAFPHKHDILFTLFRPLGLSVELFFRYLKPSFFLFLILAAPFFQQLRAQIKPLFYTKAFRWQTFAVYVGILFLFLAPAHWAMGGAPARRAMNILCYIHVVFVFLMYAQMLWAKPEKTERVLAKISRFYPRKLQIPVFVLSLFVISNIGEAWADLLFRAPTYASEQQGRVTQMTQAGSGADVTFAPLTYKPETLYFSDVTEDPQDWINQSVAHYFGVKSVIGKTK
jgi:hypothetical protein